MWSRLNDARPAVFLHRRFGVDSRIVVDKTVKMVYAITTELLLICSASFTQGPLRLPLSTAKGKCLDKVFVSRL